MGIPVINLALWAVDNTLLGAKTNELLVLRIFVACCVI